MDLGIGYSYNYDTTELSDCSQVFSNQIRVLALMIDAIVTLVHTLHLKGHAVSTYSTCSACHDMHFCHARDFLCVLAAY